MDLGRAAAPDETTIERFRHILKQHDLGGKILTKANLYLDRQGIRITTIVDATIIQAPTSTNNSTGKRDPEMHQTRKGKSGAAAVSMAGFLPTKLAEYLHASAQPERRQRRQFRGRAKRGNRPASTVKCDTKGCSGSCFRFAFLSSSLGTI